MSASQDLENISRPRISHKFGVATPTETAAIGGAGAVLCAAVNRKFSWGLLKEAAYATFRLTGIVMWLCFASPHR